MDETVPVCIIHTTDEDPNAGLTSPRDLDSWSTLLRAARLRQHQAILTVAENLKEGELPQIHYHLKCRKLFTMKRALDKLEISNAEEDDTNTKRKSLRTLPSSSSRVMEKSCIFCPPGRSKYIKGTNTREKLTQCAQLRADNTLRDIATKRQDEHILAVTSRNIVAAEAWYHRSCYRSYCSVKDIIDHTKDDASADPDPKYKIAETESYLHLFQYIRQELFQHPKVVTLTYLAHLLSTYLHSEGETIVRDSTRKHIRRNLEAEFKDTLHICSDDKGKLLVFPYTLTIYDLAKENHQLKRELESAQSKSSEFASVINKTASHLRSAIKSQEPTKQWPFLPTAMNEPTTTAPEVVKQFLYGLLCGDMTPKNPSQRTMMLVDSFSQDLVYAVSSGSQVPPKHILLPCVVKALTGNVEIIQMLNRLGHGVSYTVIEENETSLCLRKLAATDDDAVLPETIKAHVNTTLAWDNIDRLEETLTGEGTSHRVNGIAVQPRVFGPQPLKPQQTNTVKAKKRSLTVSDTPLPIYISGERIGPQSFKTIDIDITQVLKTALQKDLVWFLARQIDPTNQHIMAWTGFNIITRNDIQVFQDVVGYLPTINGPATNMSTVNEVLNQSDNIRKTLKLEKVVVVLDQALYAKATEIQWKHHDKFQNVILRMGTFHTICNFLSVIGKRFQGSGLKSIIIEAGVVAEGSISGVLEGRQYNRGVRTHKYMYEALLRLAWKEFLLWMQEHHADHVPSVEAGLEVIRDLHEDLSQKVFEETLMNEELQGLMHYFTEYMDELRNNNGPLSAYWMSYIDMVSILIGLIRGTREGNWQLHMACIREYIPWVFAYDKVNYARYLSAYYAEMSQLSNNHPKIYEQFMEGKFSVQIGSTNTFGRIPVDQTIEETVNRDTKTPGGTCRFSLNTSAVTRYYLTAEYRSEYVRLLRQILQMNRNQHHAELQKSRITKDEQAVSAIVEVIEDLVNPFSDPKDLLNISNATVVSTEIAQDLASAKNRGESAYETFKKERLESDPPIIKFHDRLPKLKLKTFADANKKKHVRSGTGKELILRTTTALFGNMLMMAQTRQLDMRKVLEHPLGPLPWALATADGVPRKTSKSSLARELKKNIGPAEDIEPHSACLIDGMALVHKVKGEHKTYGDIASLVLLKALNEASHSSRVDIVFDVYNEESIKNVERGVRGSNVGVIQLKNITAKQKVVQWQKFLTASPNKTSLIHFFIQEWRQAKYTEQLGSKSLFVTCGENCYKILHDEGCVLIPELCSTQEEADTRLILHSAHAAVAGFASVIIVADDTDVFLLALAFCDEIDTHLYLKCGTQARVSYIDVQKVSITLGPSVCKALLGMHAYTGCDSVSSFAGRGKMASLKMLKQDAELQTTFADLGAMWDVSESLLNKLEAFTCQMYVTKTSIQHSNELRYHLFTSKKGCVEPHQLPPCADALHKHACRANYQAGIWRRSLEANPEVPSPRGRGWKIDITYGKEELKIDWLDGTPAPDSVLELLACSCSRSCHLPQCTCMINNMKCSELCKLRNCDNQPQDEDEDDPQMMDDVAEIEELEFE